MAQKTSTKTIEWDEVVSYTSTEKSIPKKQITETFDSIMDCAQKLASSNQPKKAGDVVLLDTPAVEYVATRVPESIVTDAAGNKVTRPECVVVNSHIPTDIITAFNVGLVDDSEIEKHSTKKEA